MEGSGQPGSAGPPLRSPVPRTGRSQRPADRPRLIGGTWEPPVALRKRPFVLAIPTLGGQQVWKSRCIDIKLDAMIFHINCSWNKGSYK